MIALERQTQEIFSLESCVLPFIMGSTVGISTAEMSLHRILCLVQEETKWTFLTFDLKELEHVQDGRREINKINNDKEPEEWCDDGDERGGMFLFRVLFCQR